MVKKKIEAKIKIAKPKKGKVKVEINLEPTPKGKIEGQLAEPNEKEMAEELLKMDIKKSEVFFDGRYISEILGDANEKECLCLMSDGTKTLVPKDVFLKE